jgi:hypothetical protein
MTNPTFLFCTFQENLIHRVLEEQPRDDTVFIFPTEHSRRAAIKEFQKSWRFSRTCFYSMAEFKELVFLPDKPVLRDTKRSLAFYASLSEEDKKFFNINNYFQSMELASNFFELWHELNEELAQPEKLQESGYALHEWQLNTFTRLQKIKNQYADYIHERGFEDLIFSHQLQHIRLDGINLTRFVFVNQFYYSALEKSLISLLSEKKNVVVYFQMPQKWVDSQKLTVKPFTFRDLSDYKTQKIHMIESQNDFSMIVALFKVLEKHQVRHVIDVSFKSKSYSRFFSWRQFNLSPTLGMNKTSLFQFFSMLHNLVDSLRWDPERLKMLLPLQVLCDAIGSGPFIFYFFQGNLKEKKKSQIVLLHYLFSLIKSDFRHIDLEGEFLHEISNRAENTLLAPLMEFLIQILTIRRISDLIHMIDQEHGIRIRQILTEQELDCSDILDTFYRLLSDFSSVENPALIMDWALFFNAPPGGVRSKSIPAGILRLLLEYMKSTSVKQDYTSPPPGRIDITELEKTRNLNYPNVAILNVIEGRIPHAQRPPFLFTENQRRFLNLVTYDDIRLRDKYYFARLLLTTPEVFLFTQKNLDQDIDSSSFTEEIKLAFPADLLTCTLQPDQNYQIVYQNFLHSCDYQIDAAISAHSDFYIVPYDRHTDFPNSRLDLSYYVWETLHNNLFAYFIRHICKCDELVKTVPEEISGKLLGTLVHSIFLYCWQTIIEGSAAPLFGYDFNSVNHDFIAKMVKKLYNRLEIYYQIPHDHTFLYFEYILRPVITEGILMFFKRLDGLHLSGKRLTIIPEKEYVESEKQKNRILYSPAENPLNMPIGVRGKADLIIEDHAEQKNYIFDYKTGNHDAAQLIFYELFYFILEKNQVYVINSYFFQVLKNEWHKLSDSDRMKKTSEVKNSVLSAVAEICSHGFSLPFKRQDLSEMEEITRADLYRMKNLNEHVH